MAKAADDADIDVCGLSDYDQGAVIALTSLGDGKHAVSSVNDLRDGRKPHSGGISHCGGCPQVEGQLLQLLPFSVTSFELVVSIARSVLGLATLGRF